MEKMTKRQFKQLHAGGELLLLWAGLGTKEHFAELLGEKLAAGEYLPDYARPVTSYGHIDDRHHAVYIDEANGLVYMERIEEGDDWKNWSSHRPEPHTTIYILN